ncbi:MAG: hypothetical protein II811_06610 [Spirochaetaceae bacterium]|mgnify:FL=1|nr:hypothetical protein [Spirochaetaceae bacterium]
MKILELKQIEREPGQVYYRRKFTAIASMEILAKEVDVPINFIIETGPLGDKKIDFGDIKGDFSYPILPIVKSLREYVKRMDNEGALPL